MNERVGLIGTAGGSLRHAIFNKLTPILLGCDEIPDSRIRLLIQACCLDLVTELEAIIQRYHLDAGSQHDVRLKGE